MTGLHITHAHAALRLDEALLGALVRLVLDREARTLDFLGIILTDRASLRALNKRFRGGDYDTDVLSFPMGDSQAIDGEVYVSLDYAKARCEEFGASFVEEALRYVLHGILHLVGYDDKDARGQAGMRRLEDLYLGSLAEAGYNLSDDVGALHDVEMNTGDAEVE